ncbi:MAG TPA: helix-turn-helix domain-containing protein [Burkholderiales bacterium]|nr:helix-turn-helix domain-containing protein [Burkholderiales bacterium]
MKKVTLPFNFGNYDFKELAKKEKTASLKVRYLALSHIASGKTVLESAMIVHKSARMVHRWLNRFAKLGIEGLKDKSGRGRILCLPKEKEPDFKNIVSIFLKENKQAKITGNDIKKLLKNHYTIDCTLPTAYSILRRLKLNYAKPKSKVYLLQQPKGINILKKHLKIKKVCKLL